MLAEFSEVLIIKIWINFKREIYLPVVNFQLFDPMPASYISEKQSFSCVCLLSGVECTVDSSHIRSKLL